jgi:hypothetical protein
MLTWATGRHGIGRLVAAKVDLWHSSTAVGLRCNVRRPMVPWRDIVTQKLCAESRRVHRGICATVKQMSGTLANPSPDAGGAQESPPRPGGSPPRGVGR